MSTPHLRAIVKVVQVRFRACQAKVRNVVECIFSLYVIFRCGGTGNIWSYELFKEANNSALVTVFDFRFFNYSLAVLSDLNHDTELRRIIVHFTF